MRKVAVKQLDVRKPIFMVGMPRSGTTVISEAISLHPELAWVSNYVGRLPGLPVVSIIDRIVNGNRYGWWLRGKKNQAGTLGSYMKRFLPHTDESYGIWRRCCGEKFLSEYLIDTAATASEKRCIERYIGRILRWQNRERFFTKFTGPPRIGYLESMFPDAYFVHVVRDPRAVAASLKKVEFWQRGGGLERPWWTEGFPDEYRKVWQASDHQEMVLAALQWKWIIELTWSEAAKIPEGHYLEVKYEDFIEQPKELLSAVFDKLGLMYAKAPFKYLERHGQLSNMNDKYKQVLDEGEIAEVESVTFPVATEAGYVF